MKHYTTPFHVFFTQRERHAIMRFCNQINAIDAGVIILMAHKAVRLFWVLLEQGYINKSVAQKVIISNHAIDFECNYMAGQKVAIIDDIVISGSSISSLIVKLLSLKVRREDIQVITVATDADYFTMDFSDHHGNSALYCAIELDNASCIELSAKISKVFSQYGIPYEADYPTYACVAANTDIFSLLHDNFFWTVYDVSNENQCVASVSAYTLQPTRCLRDMLWSALGIDLDACIHLNIRCYIKRYPNGDANWCFLPLCLFEEITERDLNAVYQLLKPDGGALRLDQEVGPVAQMRYLQFYIAHRLFTLCCNAAGITLPLEPDARDMIQLFGPSAEATVHCALSRPLVPTGRACKRISRIARVASSKVCKYKQCKQFQGFLKDVAALRDALTPNEKNFWLNKVILDPYIWWYDDRELPAREKLKQGSYHYIDNQDQIADIPGRLHDGISFSALRELLLEYLPEVPESDIEVAISLFLDRAIDEGIIVPTIYHSAKDTNTKAAENYLCRIYRHGEDLPFSVADEYRLISFLRRLSKGIPDLANTAKETSDKNTPPGISYISLQKMIVLFYRMGLELGGVFNRFLGLGNDKIIHSFMCLHGAVVGTTAIDTDTHVYVQKGEDGKEYIELLSTWLKSQSILIIQKQGEAPSSLDEGGKNTVCSLHVSQMEDFLEEIGQSVLSGEVMPKINYIADLITKWWHEDSAKAGGKSRFKDGITALTSCVDVFIYASAVATEAHYFSLFWSHQARHALTRVNSDAICSAFGDSGENAQYTEQTNQGLNSGRDKVQWFYAGLARETIDHVAELLDSETAKAWENVWSFAEPRFSPATKELQEDVLTMEGLIFFFSACFDCVQSTGFWDHGTLPKQFDEYEALYNAHCNRHTFPGSLFEKLRTIAKSGEDGSQTIAARAEEFYHFVHAQLDVSECTISRIEDVVKQRAPSYVLSYSSALIFDVEPLDTVDTDQILLAYWRSLPEDERKTELNIIPFPRPEDGDRVRYGLFYGIDNPQGNRVLDGRIGSEKTTLQARADILLGLFTALSAHFSGRAYTIRGLLFPSLPGGHFFRHDLQRNIELRANKFNDAVVRPLEALYTPQSTKQMVVAYCNGIVCAMPSSLPLERVNLSGIAAPAWLTAVETSRNHLPSGSGDISTYSVVRIMINEKDRGLGFLLRLSDQVVCVTCTHVIKADSDEAMEIWGSSVLDPTICFPLRPLTDIPSHARRSRLIPAKQEIAVLSPCWEGNIPLDLRSILCLGDLQVEIGPMTQIGYKCCGLSSGHFQWTPSPLYATGAVEKGYYQFDGAVDTVQPGFSGGIYVPVKADDHPTVVGMHKGQFNNNPRHCRVIPSNLILERIKEVVQDG